MGGVRVVRVLPALGQPASQEFIDYVNIEEVKHKKASWTTGNWAHSDGHH
jgi:hypothetical protein